MAGPAVILKPTFIPLFDPKAQPLSFYLTDQFSKKNCIFCSLVALSLFFIMIVKLLLAKGSDLYFGLAQQSYDYSLLISLSDLLISLSDLLTFWP